MKAQQSGLEAHPLEVLDWCVTLGCANHDAQNALKWSLASLTDEGNVVRRLWITVAATRNGFHFLHAKVPTFVAQKLHLSDQDFDTQQVTSFWATLGVHPQVAYVLGQLNLVWVDGCIDVSPKHGAEHRRPC